jgi:hypothetical protein
MSDQRIDPERIRPELVEAASRAAFFQPKHWEPSARKVIEGFLSALLADEEAMGRAVDTWYDRRRAAGEDYQRTFRASLIAAVTTTSVDP